MLQKSVPLALLLQEQDTWQPGRVAPPRALMSKILEAAVYWGHLWCQARERQNACFISLSFTASCKISTNWQLQRLTCWWLAQGPKASSWQIQTWTPSLQSLAPTPTTPAGLGWPHSCQHTYGHTSYSIQARASIFQKRNLRPLDFKWIAECHPLIRLKSTVGNQI